MTFDRDSLIADYAQQIMDSMDMKTMECFVYDTLKDNLSSYSDQELIDEVTEYNPDLLEDVTVWEVAHAALRSRFWPCRLITYQTNRDHDQQSLRRSDPRPG